MIFNIKDILNMFALLIASYTVYGYLLNYFYNYDIDFESFTNYFLLYIVIDCLFSKIDMIIHHLIVIFIIIIGNLHNIKGDDFIKMSYFLFRPEISTLPLKIIDLCNILDIERKFKYGKIFKDIIQIIFVIFFIYFRIIDYPLLYFYNKDFNKIVNKYNVNYATNIIIPSFFILNLYWLSLIYKKFIAVIFKS